MPGNEYGFLLILQGLDASGKDGTIRHVMSGVNPQGCHVSSFKVPSLVEANHDYLWRIHQSVPARGRFVIFNRSHYEDVLVVRVHADNALPEWARKRKKPVERALRANQPFRAAPDAEQYRDRQGAACDISKEEQKRRLESAAEGPGEELEILRLRPGGTQALGRLHARV